LQLATSLVEGTARVQTTEHLMAALYACGVDNALVELDGGEVPIMDGSAAPFLYLIEEAGLKRQAAERKILTITRPFHFEHGGKMLSAYPCENLRITYHIHFDHPLIQSQQKTVEINAGDFEKEVGKARTFGFLKDVQALKKLGLVQGGSMDNAIVLDGDRMLNASLRQKDEFVSHKILDCVGDLALCGYRLAGHFVAHRAGHEVHARFLAALLASSAYELRGQEQIKPVAAALPGEALLLPA
jgi:UDP-3-O-[3-hydroxymyristoyl] N-acetylglucosamine deacetylase